MPPGRRHLKSPARLEHELSGVEGEEWIGIGMVLPVRGGKEGDGREEDKAPVIREQRRRGNGFPQGHMRKYRKLQGPVCKQNFPVI
jgi:hypothetical protein